MALVCQLGMTLAMVPTRLCSERSLCALSSPQSSVQTIHTRPAFIPTSHSGGADGQVSLGYSVVAHSSGWQELNTTGRLSAPPPWCTSSSQRFWYMCRERTPGPQKHSPQPVIYAKGMGIYKMRRTHPIEKDGRGYVGAVLLPSSRPPPPCVSRRYRRRCKTSTDLFAAQQHGDAAVPSSAQIVEFLHCLGAPGPVACCVSTRCNFFSGFFEAPRLRVTVSNFHWGLAPQLRIGIVCWKFHKAGGHGSGGPMPASLHHSMLQAAESMLLMDLTVCSGGLDIFSSSPNLGYPTAWDATWPFSMLTISLRSNVSPPQVFIPIYHVLGYIQRDQTRKLLSHACMETGTGQPIFGGTTRDSVAFRVFLGHGS
ncbi:hypothetical protein B0H10DRAFT_1973549 [Mycena sp. CBHHK59/15]|nr:hypothetical protein B0H10DRAFT_1973549 [Mycena sp. CBHHK59/15]